MKILFIIIQCFANLSFGSDDSILGYECEVTITTTSDWTYVYFDGADVSIMDKVITTPDVDFKHIGMRIWRNINSQERIEISYRLFVNPTDRCSFIITKGNLGKTLVRMKSNSFEEKFENNANIKGDRKNRIFYSLPISKFKRKEIIATYPLIPPLVLAFYYPWYGRVEEPNSADKYWKREGRYRSIHKPLLDYYWSFNNKVMERHIEYALRAGIDGFIISWWGKGSFSDIFMERFMERLKNTSLKVTIYYEKSGEHLDEIPYIISKFGKHPSFLRINGKPVIFYYRTAVNNTPSETWTALKKLDIINIVDMIDGSLFPCIDGIHIYNPMKEKNLLSFYRGMNITAHSQGKIFSATVFPGYNDTISRTPGFVVNRKNGNFYNHIWNIAVQSNPDIILITSFNEWFEGTEIEPSEELGFFYLDCTNKYVQDFKSKGIKH